MGEWGADGWHEMADKLKVNRADPNTWKPVQKGSRAFAGRQGKLFRMLENRLAWGPVEAIRQVLPLLDPDWGSFHIAMAGALRIAAIWNRLDALPHLLAVEPDLNVTELPPLSQAMFEGHAEFARILLEHGARFEEGLAGETFEQLIPENAHEPFRALEREFAGLHPSAPRRLGSPHIIELYGVSMATEALDDLADEAGAKKPFSSFCTDADHDRRNKLRSPRTVLQMVRRYIGYLEAHAHEFRSGLRTDFRQGTVDLATVLGDLRAIEEDADLALAQGVKVVLAISR